MSTRLSFSFSCRRLSAALLLALGCGATSVAAAATPMLAVGWTQALAVDESGALWVWGSNGNSDNRTTVLGMGAQNILQINNPTRQTALSDVLAVAADTGHSLVLKSDGTVWAWGNNGAGQLGTGTSADSGTPVQVPGLSGIQKIFVGGAASYAVAADGKVWAWGNNSNGQLGDGTTTARTSPALSPALAGAVSIASVGSRTFMVKNDGTVWGWGQSSSQYGNVGDGTSTSRAAPVQLNLSGAVQVAADVYHAAVLKSDGTVWCWGDNFYGSLGNGSANPSLSPVQASISGVQSIATTSGATLAVKQDGTLWAWGQNLHRQIGDGTTAIRFTPQAVSGLSDITAVAGGLVDSVLALRRDGTVWGWGDNYSGVLGDGVNNDFRSRPEYVVTRDSNSAFDLAPSVSNGALPPFPIGVDAKGDLSYLTLTLNFNFVPGEVSPRNIYLAAQAGGNLFLHDGNGWQPYTGALPAYASNYTGTGYYSIPILPRDTDASGLAGVSVIVGYGRDANEMLSNGRYRVAYTVPLR